MITRTSYINNESLILTANELNSTISNASVYGFDEPIRNLTGWFDQFLPQNRELYKLQSIENRNSQITNNSVSGSKDDSISTRWLLHRIWYVDITQSWYNDYINNRSQLINNVNRINNDIVSNGVRLSANSSHRITGSAPDMVIVDDVIEEDVWEWDIWNE